MEIRDAEQSDVDAIAALDGASPDVERLVRERTVRIADANGVVAAIAFDADTEAVRVTRLWGEADAMPRLVDEAVAFAAREGMPVEAVVPEGEATVRETLTDVGFREVGSGRRFGGETTRRYRMEP